MKFPAGRSLGAWLLGGCLLSSACARPATETNTDVLSLTDDEPVSPGVGAGCVPSSELDQSFAGYSLDDLSIEETKLGRNVDRCGVATHCLVRQFQGRVSCPYGQSEADATTCKDPSACEEGSSLFAASCHIPGTDNYRPESRVTVAVSPQLVQSQGEDAVYCTCRCDGPDTAAEYCSCPYGFICDELVSSTTSSNPDLVGSYCVRGDEKAPDPAGETCLLGARGTASGACGNEGANP